MIGRTHSLAAFTALGAVYFALEPQTISLATVLMAIFANQIGGIAPDIDQPTAPFWRNLPIGGPIGRIIDKLLGGHRFLTHSILGLILFGFLAHLLLVFIQSIFPMVDTNLVWIAFMIGMLSHLIMDTFTKEGVPWLLPIPIKFGFLPVRSMRITSGKKIETFIVAPALVAIIIIFCVTHYSELLTLLHHHIST
jgi:inner membrane protein